MQSDVDDLIAEAVLKFEQGVNKQRAEEATRLKLEYFGLRERREEAA